MNTGKDKAAVAEPKRAGETGAQAPWMEASVWTERMRTALEKGVKGGRWYSLVDKLWKETNLEASYHRVAANKGSPGVDHVSVEAYGQRLKEETSRLHSALKNGTYRPQALKRTYILKDGGRGKRPLSIPTVRDRVVHTAARHVLEPIFERTFAQHSYGFRPERGCKDALREVERLIQAGYLHIVDADFRRCFETIPHNPLLERVAEQIADSRMLQLLEAFLKQGIMENGEEWEPQEGTPQGGPLSPLLANIYLNPLDWLMEKAGLRIIRYADDLVIMCRTLSDAQHALELLARWAQENGLSLHEEKTRLVDMTQPNEHFDFLGYRFKRTVRNHKLQWYPRPKSLKKLKDKLRVPTCRSNGKSLEEIISRVNPILRGWFGYFKHAAPNTFPGVDGWVRMRLRSILRKRRHGRGRGRGKDNQRWPNAFFAEHGLISLTAAHARACSSA